MSITPKNIGGKLFDVSLGSGFMDLTTKAKIINYINLKNFCLAKENQQYEKETYWMGEIYANHITDKILIYKIYKYLINLGANNPI